MSPSVYFKNLMHFYLSAKPILFSSLIWLEYFDSLEFAWLALLLETRFAKDRGLFGKLTPFWAFPNPDPIIENIGLFIMPAKGLLPDRLALLAFGFVPGKLLGLLPPNPPMPVKFYKPPMLPKEFDRLWAFCGLTVPDFCISLAILMVSLSKISKKLTEHHFE